MSSCEVGESDRPEVPGHRVDAVIGSGASAVVWSGTDATGRQVAIKVPRRGRTLVDDEESLAEQQVLLAVQHEHLVPLRSVVPLADGREALVFELVTGAQLGAMVRSRGHLRAGEVVTVLTPVCEAVAHLHAAGGVHSDISPSNIMVTPQGRPVLLDLGAVRVAGALPDAVHGTAGFVAPEVQLGDEPAEPADVYALGAVAWFCLTGNGAPDTMMRLDTETVVSHVGPELAAVVAAAIDPDPGRRPGAAELARLFYDAVAAEPVEVVLDVDPAVALTHRLRAQAGKEAAGPAGDGSRASHRPRWWRVPGWAQRPDGAHRPDPTDRHRRPGRRGWARPMAAAALVAVPILAATGWALAAQPAEPPASATRETASAGGGPPVSAPGGPTARPTHVAKVFTTPAGPPPVTRSAAASGGTATGPAAQALLADPASPSTRPEDVLQTLSDRRAAALVDRDRRALPAVHASASPSLASDQELVSALERSDIRWEGLRLEVAEARFVSGTPTEAVLRARVDWTAYVVVTSGGQRVQRPADKGRMLDFTLARGHDGWRLRAVSAAPAT